MVISLIIVPIIICFHYNQFNLVIYIYMEEFAIGLPNMALYMDADARRILGDIDGNIVDRAGFQTILTGVGELEEAYEYLRKDTGTFNTWCQDGLPSDYVKGEIEDSNLIIILRDSDGAIRGIALLNVGESQMELLVLCSAKRPASADKLEKEFARGTDLIKMIQFLGRNLQDGIKLYALETVISLYYNFGWRFIFGCGAQERPYIKGSVKELAKYFKDHRFDRGDKETEELEGLLTAFRGRAKGVAELIRSGVAKGMEAFKIAKDNGFEMLLCQNMNPYSEYAEGKAEGSRRKTRYRRRRVRRSTRGRRRSSRNPRRRRSSRNPRRRRRKQSKKQRKGH
jgi:hypothetical protein